MTIFDVYVDGEKQEVEVSWDMIRDTRDSHLSQTDLFMLSDFPLTDEERSDLLQYRTTLRTLPQTFDTAEEAAANYPSLPVFVTGAGVRLE